jgi:hypothetical protein
MQERQTRPGTDGPMTTMVRPGPQPESYAPLAPLAVAVLLAAALVGWLLLRHEGPSTPAKVGAGPALVSPAQLERAAATLGSPIYWAGPRAGYSYELTATESGRVYVRYLPRGVAAGDPRAGFLTVGTYPGDHAYADLKRAAAGKGVNSKRLPGGGLLVVPARLPKSVYLAFPGTDYQVEVYDPTAGNARLLASNGSIKPIR